jgi:hypothetical protein
LSGSRGNLTGKTPMKPSGSPNMPISRRLRSAVPRGYSCLRILPPGRAQTFLYGRIVRNPRSTLASLSITRSTQGIGIDLRTAFHLLSGSRSSGGAIPISATARWVSLAIQPASVICLAKLGPVKLSAIRGGCQVAAGGSPIATISQDGGWATDLRQVQRRSGGSSSVLNV